MKRYILFAAVMTGFCGAASAGRLQMRVENLARVVLEGPGPGDRCRAAVSLEELGCAALPAVPALREGINSYDLDGDSQDRLRIAEANICGRCACPPGFDGRGLELEQALRRNPACPSASGNGGPRLEELRAEAAADPDKFIDERTPSEVSLAFGLPAGAAGTGLPARARLEADLAALAEVRITVDLSAQRLVVEAPGLNREFVISSGLPPEHATPGSGRCFRPDSMEEMHYSSLYNNAPMPNTVFFNGNIAIHATEAADKLGRPASHGCIRTSREDSKTIFEVVKAHGLANTSVCVTGETPAAE